MNTKQGSGMLLIGGIMELILSIFGIGMIILYLFNISPEFIAQLRITPEEGVKALLGFYGCAALHVLATIIVFACRRKAGRYLPALFIGLALIVLTNLLTNWETSGIATAVMNTLPGAVIVIGALMRKAA